ncbi:hypothetical protein [Thalassotalea ganghwensis]
MKKITHYSPTFPHGELKEIFPNIWFVQGGWEMPILTKPRITRSMTVVRENDGSLILINSMKLSESGLEALEKLGQVKSVIRLASMHGADDKFYRDRYGATLYALEGSHYTQGLTVDVSKQDSYLQPDVWFNENSKLPISKAKIWVMHSPLLKEACLVLPQNRGILIAGDVLHNTPKPNQYTNIQTKLFMRLFKLAKPYNIGVGWWYMTKPSGQELRSILDLDFQHVLPAHGEPVIDQAKAKYQSAIAHFATLSDQKMWHKTSQVTVE